MCRCTSADVSIDPTYTRGIICGFGLDINLQLAIAGVGSLVVERKRSFLMYDGMWKHKNLTL